jgi:hypothetical protein
MARRNLISEYIAAHPENTVWTPETGWQDRKTPAEMYSQGYVFSFHDQQWIYPTDTVSQRELEEIKR